MDSPFVPMVRKRTRLVPEGSERLFPEPHFNGEMVSSYLRLLERLKCQSDHDKQNLLVCNVLLIPVHKELAEFGHWWLLGFRGRMWKGLQEDVIAKLGRLGSRGKNRAGPSIVVRITSGISSKTCRGKVENEKPQECSKESNMELKLTEFVYKSHPPGIDHDVPC
ncbi:hypothetical protein J6590_030152 [Homalodisca vitripennis]|nr:hypothetical protein J6590_030152 [Homalodisca vitripennis]